MQTFKKVYFRIEAGYVWGKGIDKSIEDKFNQELKEIFPKLGFSLKEKRISCSADEYVRGHERLYCHPMDLNGELLAETIEIVKEEIKDRKTFKVRGVDIYDNFYLYSDEEFSELLEKKREIIENKIIATLKNGWRPYYDLSCIFDLFIKETRCIDKGQQCHIDGFAQGVLLDLIAKDKVKEKIHHKNIRIYKAV